jgi:hypothetical protein
MSTELTPEEEARDKQASERYTYLALALGYNELAKLGRSLGEKMYFRLARDQAVDMLVKAGGNGGKSPFTEEQAVVTIHVEDGMPWIKLLARDVDLMRAYVAEHDARGTVVEWVAPLPGEEQSK